jgi:phosphonate transport system substrate-binding protein
MPNPKSNVLFLVFIGWIFILSGCDSDQSADQALPQYADQAPESDKKIYTLGVHPLHNPKKLYSVFNPLAKYLSDQLEDVTIRVQASKDYPSYDQKLAQKAFDLTLPNPYQTITHYQYGYQTIAQMGTNDNFRGIILVRKDSGIQTIDDLRGKKISYPAPTALAATMMPQYFLHQQGLDLKNDTTTLYVGSQESSIMNVYLKLTAAGATWPIPWYDLLKNQPNVAKALKIGWQTDPLPNNSFSYRTDTVKAAHAKKIQSLLTQLHTNERGQELLALMNIQRVFPADNDTYEPIKRFMQTFRAEIGDNALLAEPETSSTVSKDSN